MPRKYSASDLRHTIEFLQRTTVDDGGGGYTVSYVSLTPKIQVPAMVEPRTSRERFQAGQTASAENVLIVIRYQTGIQQSMRIRYGTRVFEILGMIDLEERHAWMEIDAEERFGE
jgi:SPP1 family predicted phage head-tail adaptor